MHEQDTKIGKFWKEDAKTVFPAFRNVHVDDQGVQKWELPLLQMSAFRFFSRMKTGVSDNLTISKRALYQV